MLFTKKADKLEWTNVLAIISCKDVALDNDIRGTNFYRYFQLLCFADDQMNHQMEDANALGVFQYTITRLLGQVMQALWEIVCIDGKLQLRTEHPKSKPCVTVFIRDHRGVVVEHVCTCVRVHVPKKRTIASRSR